MEKWERMREWVSSKINLLVDEPRKPIHQSPNQALT